MIEMARRRRRTKAQRSAEDLGKFVFVVLAFGFLGKLLSGLAKNGHSIVGGLSQIVLVTLILTTVGLVAFYGPRFAYSVIRKSSTKGRIRRMVAAHEAELVRRRAQLLRTDGYGGTIRKKWDEEIDRFLTTQVLPETSKEWIRYKREWIRLVDDLVREAASKNPAFQTFSRDMRPSEFEAFCASELRRAGWNARTTVATRDQGADVIAEKDGLRIVLQCKLYSRPVGNKAVQEAFTAKKHEGAQIGAVVSNNRFTASAEQVAATTGVLLLHYSELSSFDTVRSKPGTLA